MRANADARRAYAAMEHDRPSRRRCNGTRFGGKISTAFSFPAGTGPAACATIWKATSCSDWSANFSPRMCRSPRSATAWCWPRAAARADGRSVLYGRRTTALTWSFERKAEMVGRVVRFWDPNYYRTYLDAPGEPTATCRCSRRSRARWREPQDFLDVPADAPDYRRKTDGLSRDTFDDARPAFVVRDGNYVSARWPGDAHTFAKTFAALLPQGDGTQNAFE